MNFRQLRYSAYLNGMVLAIAASLLVAIPISKSKAGSSQGSIATEFQLYIDNIKRRCRIEYATDNNKYRACAETRYAAMKSFHEKLFHYRDQNGVDSVEFLKGISCVDSASPSAIEPNRKKAIENADWLLANECYSSELKEATSTSFSTPEPEIKQILTGEDFMAICGTVADLGPGQSALSQDFVDLSYCVGYVQGVISTMIVSSQQTGTSFFCPPDSLSNRRLIHITNGFLDDNPESRQSNASFAVIASLIQDFPCDQ